MNKKYLSRLTKAFVLCALLYCGPASAQWPTIDIGAIFNAIKTGVSQVQTQVSTGQETLSSINIQQALGDNLGGLTKFKNPLKEAEKESKRAEKAKKYLEQLQKMRERYNQAKEDITNTVNEAQKTYNEAKEGVTNAVNEAQKTYNDAKGTVTNAVNEGQKTYNDAKGGVTNAVNEGQKIYQGAQEKYNEVNAVVQQGQAMYEGLQSQMAGGGQANNTSNNQQKGVFSGEGVSAGYGTGGGFSIGLEEDSEFDYHGNTQSTVSSDDLWVEDEDYLPEKIQDNIKEVLPQNPVTVKGPAAFGKADEANTDELIVEEQIFISDEPVKQEKTSAKESLIVEEAEDIFVTPEEDIFSSQAIEITPKADKADRVAPLKTEEPALEEVKVKEAKEKTVGPKAFGKVSYQMHTSFGFAQETEVKTCAYTGLNKDGNRVLPDTLASICCIDVSDVDLESQGEDVAIKCITQICHMMNDPDNEVRAKYMAEINKIRREAILSSFSAANEMKQKYSDISKTEDELENIKNQSSDQLRTQMSGNSELTNADVNTQKDMLLIKASSLEMDAIEAMFNYCQAYARVTDEE